jgi:integrase
MARTPKYRRHSTRDLGFVEHDGKRIYFAGAYHSAESHEAYREFLKSQGFITYDAGQEINGAVTLSLLAARFMDYVDASYPSGRKSRGANLIGSAKHLLHFSGDDLAVRFTPKRLKAFQQWLIERKNKLSRRYINDTTANIKFLFKWAVSEELIPVATYQALLTVAGLKRGRTKAKEIPPRRPVTLEHFKATLPKLSATVRVMAQVHWLTGVRSQSLCEARVSQFDRTGKLWLWRPKHKTEHLGHELTVFIGPKAQKLLAPLLDGKKPSDFVFQPKNKRGRRSKRYRSFYDPDSYRRAVMRAAKLAGVPHWSPHRLRHARGTLVREKHGLEAAQAALGHLRLDTTQLYAQKQLALARMVAETMG